MTINNANVEQINVALLDIDKRIKALNIDNEVIKSLQNSVKTIKSSLTEWVKPRTVKFVDYKTERLTFSSITDQKGIELSNFGPDVTEDNVLSFMVIYWSGIIITASGDWAKSQGTNSSGLKCALHALQAGTGWCVIRCVYLA